MGAEAKAGRQARKTAKCSVRRTELKLCVTFHWDFDFQGRFEVDVPEDQRPYLAIAGGLLHGDIYRDLAEILIGEGAIELVSKRDFRSRDAGFSRNRAIRGDDLRLVRVVDRKKRKPMAAMPDVVDYRHDRIIDLKTYFIRTAPDPGGIFVTTDQVAQSKPMGDLSPCDSEIPQGYEDAWSGLKTLVQHQLVRKYGSQFARYHEAYCQATGRAPSINVYVVLYALTQHYQRDADYEGMRRMNC